MTERLSLELTLGWILTHLSYELTLRIEETQLMVEGGHRAFPSLENEPFDVLSQLLHDMAGELGLHFPIRLSLDF